MRLITPIEPGAPFLAHRSEPGDPDLMEWIRHQIDAILGVGPNAIVIVMALVIVAIPAAILIVYLRQRYRQQRE